jgi:S1-C subfamily serine protease
MWQFKFIPKAGDDYITGLSNAEVAGFLAKVDEYFKTFPTSPGGNPVVAPKPLLGVSFGNKSELPPVLSAALGDKELKGVFIVAITPGSVADKAGMKVGDDFYEFDGKAVASVPEVKAAVATVAPGSSVSIKVIRNAAPLSLNAQF